MFLNFYVTFFFKSNLSTNFFNIIDQFKIKIDLKYILIEILCFSFFKVFKNKIQIFIKLQIQFSLSICGCTFCLRIRFAHLFYSTYKV